MGIAARIRVLDLPKETEVISGWFAAGHSGCELIAVVADNPLECNRYAEKVQPVCKVKGVRVLMVGVQKFRTNGNDLGVHEYRIAAYSRRNPVAGRAQSPAWTRTQARRGLFPARPN